MRGQAENEFGKGCLGDFKEEGQIYCIIIPRVC